jgi:nicotinamide-nucleotide amidase
MIKATLIAVGNELLNGSTLDTNSHFIGGELEKIGIRVQSVSLVSDDIEKISKALKNKTADSDLVIVTGGLGPTSDDITRNGIALVAGRKLAPHPESLKRVEDYCKLRGRELNDNHKQQAFFPEGAGILVNNVGTADAFFVEIEASPSNKSLVISLPGVPAEMKVIFSEMVKPLLVQKFPEIKPREILLLRCFGLSEALLGNIIEGLNLPQLKSGKIQIAYRPKFPEILLTFSCEVAEKNLLEETVKKVKEKIGEEFIFSTNATDSLEGIVGKLLIERKETLALAESCTGGLISKQVVNVPGASNYFLGSVVSYSNSLKEKFLGVSEETLKTYGAVSKETALEMAIGIKTKTGATYGISTTGIAGPDGGTDEKPVGTVWIGFVGKGNNGEDFSEAFQYFLPFKREGFRGYAAQLALDLLRRKLLNYSLCWDMK